MVRVVFNTGAKFKNTCLNNNILKGSDLLNNLPSVLLKFRKGHNGAMSDIQQMFHQILTNQDNQQALRFLWRENSNQTFEDYAMTVHIFGKAHSLTILSVSTLLKGGGFHLTKWTSNSIDISNTLPKITKLDLEN